MTNKLYMGDCLEILPTLADKSIDAIICDPPYGTTACKWDAVIPLDAMWKECKRVIKDRGAIVLFAAQPFTTTLITSNQKGFKYCWTWDKQGTANFAIAKYQPLRATEDVLIFGEGTTKYYPQMRQGKMRIKGGGGKCEINGMSPTHTINDMYYPTNVIRISNANFPERGLHPTQKPVALLEYLIKTYTNEGETVLDFAAGSFTTAVACVNTNRHFIGIEKDAGYFEIGKNRIEQTLPLFAEQIT